MKTRIAVIACLLCGILAAGSAALEGQKKIVFKTATNNPKLSGHYKGMQIFKQLVEERTNGAVEVELYSDAVLGDEEQMAEGLKMGVLDMYIASAAKYANFVPEMDIYSPPYTFASWDHVKKVLQSDVNKKLEKLVFDKRGDYYVGCLTDGVRNIFTRAEYPGLDSLKGIKLRTMTGPIETVSFKALGMNPTPMAYTEVYSALQTGVIDGAENSMTSLLSMKFFESCKFVLRTEHCFLVLPMIISGKSIKKLPEEYREIVLQAGRETCLQQIDWAIAYDKDNENALIQKYGVKVTDMTPADKARAQEMVANVQLDNAKRLNMVSEMEAIRTMAE